MLVKICRWAKAKDMTDFVFAMDYCFLILIWRVFTSFFIYWVKHTIQ
jgi:hypothetical protein